MSGADWQDSEVDFERRFGGLRRLWGEAAYRRVRAARVAVIGVGGVGSWAAEALVRCGISELTLIDFDQIAESNINRQIQALGSTVGAAKVDVLRTRCLDIHPGCTVRAVEEFATPENWPALLPAPVDLVIDACDQSRTKRALAAWAIDTGQRLVIAGAAGGKSQPQAVEVADLAEVTHDPLLAGLRQQVRRQLRERGQSALPKRFGLRCVFSRETVLPSQDSSCATESDGSLNCSGYGSNVMVTAAFGMAAASEALLQVRQIEIDRNLLQTQKTCL
jgi:tRNA A37 threonylcarbamoyladenosine dehydratase